MEVRFYATLRPLVGGKVADIALGDGRSVRDLLTETTRLYPDLGPKIWSEDGSLGDYIKVFVDGRDIRHLEMLETVIPEGASVDVFPPVAGGAHR